MINNEDKSEIQKVKEWYCAIGSIQCSAFGGEKVYFNKHGWRHLIRKRGLMRSSKEIMSRIKIIKYVPYILVSSVSIEKYREDFTETHHAKFWNICRFVNYIHIRVVIRQLGNGKKHYFSVMYIDKKTP